MAANPSHLPFTCIFVLWHLLRQGKCSIITLWLKNTIILGGWSVHMCSQKSCLGYFLVLSTEIYIYSINIFIHQILIWAMSNMTHLNITGKCRQIFTKLSAFFWIGLLSWLIMFVHVHVQACTQNMWKVQTTFVPFLQLFCKFFCNFDAVPS